MKYLDTKRHKWGVLAFVVAIPLIVWACSFTINNIFLEQEDPDTGEQVMYARVGEEVTFKFDGVIATEGEWSGEAFIVAILAPTSLNLAENATVTFTEDLFAGADVQNNMTVIPDNSSPKNQAGLTWDQALKNKYGVMSNVLNDMEWVAFQSTRTDYGENGKTINFTVTVKFNAGTKNLRFKPAFFVNHSSDGLSTDAQHFTCKEGECFEILGAEGATTDYCVYHYFSTTPLQALQNDFVTFTFQGDINTNELSDCNEIYWEATAYTDANPTTGYKGEKTLMKQQDGGLARYNVTIWPAGFFGIPKDETITRIDYVFTNADGTKKVTLSDDNRDNDGEEVPEGEETPFSYYFTCE